VTLTRKHRNNYKLYKIEHQIKYSGVKIIRLIMVTKNNSFLFYPRGRMQKRGRLYPLVRIREIGITAFFIGSGYAAAYSSELDEGIKLNTSPYNQSDIKCSVRNANGETIVGATVTLGRTQSSVSTDENGVFNLSASGLSSSDVLVISYI